MCGFGTPATKGLQPLIQVMASFPIPPSPSWQHGEPVYDPTDPTCFCIPSCSSCLQAQGWCKPRTPTTVHHNALLAWNRGLQDQSILKWIQHTPNSFLGGYIQHAFYIPEFLSQCVQKPQLLELPIFIFFFCNAG